MNLKYSMQCNTFSIRGMNQGLYLKGCVGIEVWRSWIHHY